MLGDELKSVMNLKNIRSVLDELQAASRMTLPLTDAVRAFENSGVQRALRAIEERDAMMRAAVRPLEDMQRAADAIRQSPLLRDVERMTEAIAALESRFRLPDMTEATALFATMRSSPLSEMLGNIAEQSASLHRVIEGLRAPWLDAQDTLRSVSGLADLHGIGHALKSMAAYDEVLAGALRSGLGDWREPISWRPEIFADFDSRADFYAGLGFDHALTDFPAPAFGEALDVTGVRRDPPPLIVRYAAPVPPADDDELEEEFARTNMAHDWLQRLETQVRGFIDREMRRAFGDDWPRHRLPNGMYDEWREKKRKAQEAKAAERPLIAYADFTDYIDVICRRDNWREVFGVYFGRAESVRESFQRLYPVRLDTMHARPITQDDELLLYVEARRLMKIMVNECPDDLG